MEGLVIFFLILIGLVLLIIEILFIPGTTIFGIFGIISIIASNYLFFQYFGPELIVYYMIGSSILVLGVIIYSLKSKTWKKVYLEKKVHQYFMADRLTVIAYTNLKRLKN